MSTDLFNFHCASVLKSSTFIGIGSSVRIFLRVEVEELYALYSLME